MSVTQNYTVGDSAVAELLEQFKGKPQLEALVRALTAPPSSGAGAQELEKALADALALNVLATAVGAQLERFRVIVNCPPGESGDRLRAAIYLQIAINTSQGQSERLIDITQRISAASFVHYIRKMDGACTLYCHLLKDWSMLYRVESAAEGGGRVVITGSLVDDVFVCGADRDAAGVAHGSELSYGLGFGEVE